MFEKPYIAVDIGSSSIKILEIQMGKKPKILNMGLELLPRNAVSDGKINDPDQTSRVAKLLFSRLKMTIKNRRAAISIGGDQVLIKKIFMPIGTPSEMDDQIQAEAKQNFHADIEELYWQPLVMRHLMDERGEVPVYLVAVDRNIVDQKIELIKSLGMSLGLVDCEVFTLLNMFEFNYSQDNSLTGIINIGAQATHLAIFYQGMQVYSRELQIGGRRYTESIVEVAGVDFDNAEIMKIAASNGEQGVPNEVIDVINNLNQELCEQIKTALDDFKQIEVDYQGIAVEKIMLTGGSCRLLGLSSAMASTVMLPTEIINPLKNISYDSKKINPNMIEYQGNIFSICFGLAIRTKNDHMQEAV